MVGNLGRQHGGPLLPFVLAAAGILLQSCPNDCGLRLLPLPPWAYGGWLPFSISLVYWGAVLVGVYAVVSGCIDAPQSFRCRLPDRHRVKRSPVVLHLISFVQAPSQSRRGRRAMLRLLGNIIFGIGWLVGTLKYRLGAIVHIPEKYRH